jgi:hypothetical protein
VKILHASALCLLFFYCESALAFCRPAGGADFSKELRRGGFTGLVSGRFEIKAESGVYCFYSYQYSAKTQGGTTYWALVIFKRGRYLGLYEVPASKVSVSDRKVIVHDIFGQTGSFKLSDMVIGKKIFLIDDNHTFSK